MRTIKIVLAILMLAITNHSYSSKFFRKKFYTKLTEVTINENSKVKLDRNTNTYIDENIELTLSISTKNPRFFGFSIKNKTDEPITINWSNVSLIDNKGLSLKLKLKGDLNETMIPPHTHIIEDNRTYLYDRMLLYPYYYTKNALVLNNWIDYYIGKDMTLFIPLTYNNNKTIYYKAKIVIESLDILQHNPDTEYKKVNSMPTIKTKRGN